MLEIGENSFESGVRHSRMLQLFSPISPRATITSPGAVLTPLIRTLNQEVVDGRIQGLLYLAYCAALRVPGPVLYPYIRFLHTYKHL